MQTLRLGLFIMKIPFDIRIKSFFAKDKAAFWWSHFSDEEKMLKRMDVWELAAVIQEANVRLGMEKKKIVAEHMLNVRLAQIQSKASWGSGILGFVGAIVGAALSVSLTNILQTPCEADLNSQQTIANPVKDLQKSSANPDLQ